MYLITFFGVLMMLLSIVMMVSPGYWSAGIIKFSKKYYFHSVEILSRLLFGLAFIMFSNQTAHPMIILAVGYILVVVSITLLITPPLMHKQFAVWSAQRFLKVFRPAGLFSFMCGMFLVYTTL